MSLISLFPPVARPGRRAQIIGQRFGVMGELGAGSTYARSESRLYQNSGPSGVYIDRLFFAGYEIQLTTNEIPASNPFQVECCIELAGNPLFGFIPVTFSGAASASIPVGSSGIISDPVGIYIPPNSAYYIRTGIIVTAGQSYLRGIQTNRFTGESCIESNSSTSQIMGTGNLTVPSGGSAASAGGYAYAPFLVTGYTEKPTISVVTLGDSIARGAADTATTGPRGFIERGLDAAGVYYMHTARSGQTFFRTRPNLAPRQRIAFQYATHALIQLSVNDIDGGFQTLAQVQANALERYGALRASGAKVYQTLTTPRVTSSTNQFLTAAEQTVRPGFEIGGVRDQFMAWVKSQVGVTLDGFIDQNIYIEDPNNHGKFLTDGVTPNLITDAGVHLTTYGATQAAKAVTAWAQALTP